MHPNSRENLQKYQGQTGIEAEIDPMTLARLDYGLFTALRKLGTSKDRICSALCLSYAEYDYVSRLKRAEPLRPAERA